MIDDADSTRIEFVGPWQRDAGTCPSHAGTLSVATQPRASFTLHFQGRGVVWHSRLGAEGGLARIVVDGGEPVTVSCYAADEIPGWPLFERSWSDAGDHVMRVEVLGTPDARGAGTRVWLDAVSLEK